MDVRKQPALLALWAALASPVSVSADGFAPHSMQEMARHLGIGCGPGYHAAPCTPWGQQHYHGVTGAYPQLVNSPMLGPTCPSGQCGLPQTPAIRHAPLTRTWAPPALPQFEAAPPIEDFSPQIIDGPTLYPADTQNVPHVSTPLAPNQVPTGVSPSDQQLPQWMEQERRAIEPYLLKNQTTPQATPQQSPTIKDNSEEDLPPPSIDEIDENSRPALDSNSDRAEDDELLDDSESTPPASPPTLPPTDDDDELLDSDDELLDSYYRPRATHGPAWHTARGPQPMLPSPAAPNRASQPQPQTDLWRSYQRPNPAPAQRPPAPSQPPSPSYRWWY